jgi:hypothetical protein
MCVKEMDWTESAGDKIGSGRDILRDPGRIMLARTGSADPCDLPGGASLDLYWLAMPRPNHTPFVHVQQCLNLARRTPEILFRPLTPT